jgi:aminoglycoside 3-N-acetyltransferase I
VSDASAVSRDATFRVQQLVPGDIALMHGMLGMFSAAFEDPDSYDKKRPRDAYLEKLLSRDTFIALVALHGDHVIGGIAAYELHKFEQERSEIYIYDLAVSAAHRRLGVATALIEELRVIARNRGAYVVYVQADYVDPPAIALYTKLGTREDVLHFDISVAD